MRRAALVTVMSVMSVPTMAGAEPIDQMAVLTAEVMDLYVYEPICGYSIYKEKLDIYLLGTPMFWGEPVSQSEIEEARTSELALIGTDSHKKTRKCRSVSDRFGPSGVRARGILR